MAAVLITASLGVSYANNVKIALSKDFESMEPYTLFESASIFFLNNIYEALVRFDTDLEIEPALAKSWELIEPTLIRFHLREGVKFHNGYDFTADDVVFSYKRAMGEGALMGWTTHSISEVRKVDDYTVDMELKYPNVALLNEISNLYIMSKKWAEENNALQPVNHREGEEGATTRAAMGTGPFILESREPGVVTVVRRNPDWWDTPRHNVERAEFRPIESDATRVAALLSGEVDFIDPVPLQDISRVESSPNAKVLQGPSVRTVFIGLNQKADELTSSNLRGVNPFKDRRVRLAMYQAIDVEAIRDKIMLSASTPTAILIAPGISGHDPSIERYPYDLNKARELMAGAGFANGFEVTMDCPNESEAVNGAQICQAIVPMWARIGITVDLLIQTSSRFEEKMLAGRSDIYLGNIGSANVKDGSSIVNLALRTPEEGTRNGWFNPGGYSNPRIDEIGTVVNQEFDREERQVLFSEALRLAHEDVGVLPLHQQNIVWGMKPNVDVPQTPDNFLRLWLMQVE